MKEQPDLKEFMQLVATFSRVTEEEFLERYWIHCKNSRGDGVLAWQWFRDAPIRFFESSSMTELSKAVYQLAVEKLAKKRMPEKRNRKLQPQQFALGDEVLVRASHNKGIVIGVYAGSPSAPDGCVYRVCIYHDIESQCYDYEADQLALIEKNKQITREIDGLEGNRG